MEKEVFFYWHGRGVGRIMDISEGNKVKVFFSKEGEKEVDRGLFEKKSVILEPESFKVFEVFYPEKLKKFMENFSLDILEIIKKDYCAIYHKEATEELPFDFIRSLLKPHFQDKKSWERWWGKFRKKIKSSLQKTEQIDFSADFPTVWNTFRHRVKRLSSEEQQKFTNYFLEQVFNDDFSTSFRSFLGLKQLQKEIPQDVISHLKESLRKKSMSEEFSFIKVYDAREQEELVDFIQNHVPAEVKKGYFLRILIVPSRSKKAKEKLLADLQKTETFILDLRNVFAETKAEAKDVITGLKDIIVLLSKYHRQKAYDLAMEVLPVLFKNYRWQKGFIGLAKTFRELFLNPFPSGFLYYGVLAVLQDLSVKSGNREEVMRFFESVITDLDREKLKDLVFISTFFNSLKDYFPLPVNMPIDVRTGVKFLRRDLKGWSSEAHRQIETLIFNYKKLQQKELKIELGDTSNIVQQLKSSLREKIPDEELELMLKWLVLSPSGISDLIQILECWRKAYADLYSEFERFREKVNSPEFIQKRTGEEIKRQLLLKKETLKESMAADLERKKQELMKNNSEILCALAYFFQTTQNLPAEPKRVLLNKFSEIARKWGYRIIGEVGEEIKEFIPEYYDFVGEIPKEGSEKSKLCVLYPGCVYEAAGKEIVLNKALVRRETR